MTKAGSLGSATGLWGFLSGLCLSLAACHWSVYHPLTWFGALQLLIIGGLVALVLCFGAALFYWRAGGDSARHVVRNRGRAFATWFLALHLLWLVGLGLLVMGLGFLFGFGWMLIWSGSALFGLALFALAGLKGPFPATLSLCWTVSGLKEFLRPTGFGAAVGLRARYDWAARQDLRRGFSGLSKLTRLLEGGDLSALSLTRDGFDIRNFYREIALRAPAFMVFFATAGLVVAVYSLLIFGDVQLRLPPGSALADGPLFGTEQSNETTAAADGNDSGSSSDHKGDSSKGEKSGSGPSNETEARSGQPVKPGADGPSQSAANRSEGNSSDGSERADQPGTSNDSHGESPPEKSGEASSSESGETGEPSQSGPEGADPNKPEPESGGVGQNEDTEPKAESNQAGQGMGEGPGEGSEESRGDGSGGEKGETGQAGPTDQRGEGSESGSKSPGNADGETAPGEGQGEGDGAGKPGSQSGEKPGNQQQSGKQEGQGKGQGQGEGQGGGSDGKPTRGVPEPPPISQSGVETMVTLDIPALGPTQSTQESAQKKPQRAEQTTYETGSQDTTRRKGEAETEPVQHLPNWIRVFSPTKKKE